MISAHLTVNIESRAAVDWKEDLAKGLELLAASIRERKMPRKQSVTDTIRYGSSEVNYTLVSFQEKPIA